MDCSRVEDFSGLSGYYRQEIGGGYARFEGHSDSRAAAPGEPDLFPANRSFGAASRSGLAEFPVILRDPCQRVRMSS